MATENIILLLIACGLGLLAAVMTNRAEAWKRLYRTLDEMHDAAKKKAEAAEIKGHLKHKSFQAFARKNRKRGHTIADREKRISALKAENTELRKQLQAAVGTVTALNKQMSRDSKKFLKTIGEQEAEILRLRRREDCPHIKKAANGITYCERKKHVVES